MAQLSRWQQMILPLGLIASVLVILIPLPPAIMDVLLVGNITLAVIVLLTTIYVRTPLEFSIFPSVLLAGTLARLVLNVATTRLILTHGATDKTAAAGGVIQRFGDFVAQNQIIVGLVIFTIIIVIQFVVITKGATRISEVAARFALDGMPGRQMAIDADLSAGVIDDHEAQRRREELTQQADFFGAMDGASKFVRGDAIAGIIITAVNIVGGLAIGIFDAGMSASQAASTFTKLTIGDGLVSQIPAFLTALAAGLLVTRSTQRVDLPTEFMRQLFSRPQALVIASLFLLALVFTKLPALPLLTIGTGCLGLAIMLNRQTEADEEADGESATATAAPTDEKKDQDRVEDFLAIDPLEIELGVGLIRLADPNRGGDLLTRVTGVRRRVAEELGIILPKVRIRDNMQLGRREYQIKIANIPVARGSIYPDRMLAVHQPGADGEISGEPVTEPVTGNPATWIRQEELARAEAQGYRLAGAPESLALHLQDVVHQHADELLSRDATQHLLQELRKSSPAVVDELVPNLLSLSEVQQVLRLLLREDVPIRQLGIILETIGDYATRVKDPAQLAEQVRVRLARTLSTRLRDEAGRLHVVTFDNSIEESLADATAATRDNSNLQVDRQLLDRLLQNLKARVQSLREAGRPAVLLVRPHVRSAVAQLLRGKLPRLVVLSHAEVTNDTEIYSEGRVTLSPAGE